MVPTQISDTLTRWITNTQFKPKYRRALLPIVMLTLIAADPTRDLAVNALSDAFWAVSAYVAFTLAIYHYFSVFINRDNGIVRLYSYSRNYQVLFAAILGALPGCGGAIIVTTQFISGRVGFGAVVAVLTATMGDAAFLLLASKPDIGSAVVATGVVVGAITGWGVNALHQDDFLRPTNLTGGATRHNSSRPTRLEQMAINLQGKVWRLLLIPATIIAFMGSFQVDVNEALNLPGMTIEWIGAILIIICMTLWALTKEIEDYESSVSEDKKCIASHPLQKTAQDTNFVTAWVVMAFLAFELATSFAGINLSALFSHWGIWLPLAGLTIGLLPGCGPQILVTSLYISGAVPLSAQLANAISNDGDALFPALALAPKAALVATFYSALPAFFVGYGYYFFFEI
ncbi:putative manganese transporter [Vibrio sp. JC009]|uniref:putative manganese transporter n=1 Tax=Vibrio sp. JC009 TaxID=2912314 RepID=UPI0023B105E5|nr:putative manganese transporter [Vibrio sp. JC009]WED23934.1 putative manganese transporter [Vibrio sp. JC009]